MNGRTLDRTTIVIISIALVFTLVFMFMMPGMTESTTSFAYPEKLFGEEIIEIAIKADPIQWQNMLDNATREEYVPADITINGTTFQQVGIRPKGNSSLSMVAGSDSDRYSFKLQFDEYINGQTCFGLDKFVLNNMHADYTYMKEFLSYYLMAYAGVDAPLVNYAHITVNGAEWGLYLAIETYEDSFVQRVYNTTRGNLYSVKMSMGKGKEESGVWQGVDEMPEGAEGFPEGMQMPEGMEGFPGGMQMPEGLEGFPEGMRRPEGSEIPGGLQRPEGTSGASNENTAGAEISDASGGSISNQATDPTNGNSRQNTGNPSSLRNRGGMGDPAATGGFGGRGAIGGFPGGAMGGFPGGAMGGFNRGQSGGGNLVYTDDNLSSYSAIFNNTILKTTDDTDKQRLVEAIRKLSVGNDLEQYFDVDQILRYFAVHTAVVNLDSYISSMQQNFYLYEEDGKVTILPWDYNLAFGGFQSSGASPAVNFPIDTPVSGVSLSDRPLIGKLLEVESYKEQYHACLQKITDFISSEAFDQLITSTESKISDYVKNDTTRFCTYEQYQEAVQTLIKFCKLRAQSIQGQLDGTIPSDSAGQANSNALIEASSINLNKMGSQGMGGRGGNMDPPGGNRRLAPVPPVPGYR